MGDTWIVDMSHFDFPDEEIHNIPKQAHRLAEYLGSIIEETLWRRTIIPGAIGIRCRRRPGRISCPGLIHFELHTEGNELYCWRPVCGHNGRISNWIGKRWDPSEKRIESGELFEMKSVEKAIDEEVYENIQGTIEWDEASDRNLPRIVTKGKVYSWSDLGKKLMTYEGFHKVYFF